MKPLKIVTYNLRQDTKHDGEQAFKYRKTYVLARLLEESPDIIGFQEVLPHMLDWLKDNLCDYTILGYGRGADFSDEANPIAFKSNRFELQYFDQRWLSDTPLVPGSRFIDQSGCPRVYCVCTLRDRDQDGAGRFRFFNTHLDHERDYAKIEGIKQIACDHDRLNRECQLPSVLTGDFNALPQSDPLSIAYKNMFMRDLTEGSGGTFHGYGRIEERQKIDYILSDMGTEACGVRVWDETRDGLYLSDHFPVEVAVTSWGNLPR